MIARAGVRQPWLIAQLQATHANQVFIKPSPQVIADIFF